MSELANFFKIKDKPKKHSESFFNIINSLKLTLETKKSLDIVNSYLAKTRRSSYANDDVKKEIESDIFRSVKSCGQFLSNGENYDEGIKEIISDLPSEYNLLKTLSEEIVCSLSSIKEICDKTGLVFIPISYIKKDKIKKNEQLKAMLETYEQWAVEAYAIVNISSLSLSSINTSNIKPCYLGKYELKITPMLVTMITIDSLPFRSKDKVISSYQKTINDFDGNDFNVHGYTWLCSNKKTSDFNQNITFRKSPLNLVTGSETKLKPVKKSKHPVSMEKNKGSEKPLDKANALKVDFTYQGVSVFKDQDGYTINEKPGLYRTKSGVQSAIRAMHKSSTKNENTKKVDFTYQGVSVYKNDTGFFTLGDNKKEYSTKSGIQSAIRSSLKVKL